MNDATLNLLLLVGLALFLANLPFVGNRVFGVLRISEPKSFWWYLLELTVGYLLVGLVAYLLEKQSGPVHQQGWEFFAVTVFLYLVFGYPGFVWRFLWRRRPAKATKRAERGPAAN